MRRARPAALLALVPLVAAGGVATAATRAASVRDLPGTKCTAFPADNVWHASVASLPVDPHSAEWIRHIGSADLHPDFGPAFGAQPVPYGIPITYVSGSHPWVKVKFQYAAESDRVRYPLGSDTKIEGGKTAPLHSDRHAIVVDRASCKLYETWHTRHGASGWTAGSGAIWSLNSNDLRPAGWTSADAAGLPILPGLLRRDEVRSGFVDHAIRFTAEHTSIHYIWPARHEAGDHSSINYPPMGARFRLKASVSLAGYHGAALIILQALKTYGMIVADNGSNWYLSGATYTGWNDDDLNQLKNVPGSDFEAVYTGPVKH
jgi:hypothetical protein